MDPGTGRPGQLVETVRFRTWATVTGDSCTTPWALWHQREFTGTDGRSSRSSLGHLVDPAGTWARARVTRETWLTPGALGRGHESPRRVCRPRGPSVQSAMHPEKLVDGVGPRTKARVARDNWSNTWTLRLERDTPGLAGLARGPSDPGPSGPGELVDPAGHRTQVRVSRDSWSTRCSHGPGPESPGISG